MSQESGQIMVKLNSESVNIQSRIDSDGDLKVEVQGELELDPHRRYERVGIEYTVRNAENRVLVREDNYVDLTYNVDGRVSFSNNIYIKPPMSKEAANVELRASAQLIVVDRPIRMDLPKPRD
jgi:hypothetical protein